MVENKVSSAANNNSEGSGDFNDVDMKSPREREGFVNGVQVAKDKENGVMNDNELANGVVDIPSPTEQKSQVEYSRSFFSPNILIGLPLKEKTRKKETLFL